MNRNKAVVLAKTETTYGTDPSPVGTDALIVYDFDWKVAEKRLERKFLRPTMGGPTFVNSGEAIDITFKVDFSGTMGESDEPPTCGKLLEACNMTETVSTGTRVTYAPNSLQSTASSLTFYWYLDGVLHKATGCRGNMKFDLVPGELAMLEFSFKGLYKTDHNSVASIVSPTFPTDAANIFQNAAVTINSVSTYAVSKLSYDLGNDVQLMPDANVASGFGRVVIVNRASTGSIGVEAQAATTWWTAYENSSQWDMDFVIGQSGGNDVEVSIANCQFAAPNYSGDIVLHDMAYNCVPSTSGNDEIGIVFNPI